MQLDPSAFVANPELIQVLEKHSFIIFCSEEHVLFKQGDIPAGLYILHQGAASLTMASPTGQQVMQVEAPIGSLLGLPALISGEPYTLSATAHSGAQLSFVARDQFTSLMQTDPQLALKILQVLAAEVRSARSAISGR